MGKKVTFPLTIGPTHPAFKEPMKFHFEIDGEEVVTTDIDMGYTHRAIEWVARERNFIQIIYLMERVCGICSTTHPSSYTLSIENAAGIEAPPRAKYIRSIIEELERLHSHLLWAGVAAHEIGFDTLFYAVWQVRERVLDSLEIITGNRVNYAMLTIGGVRRDLTEEHYSILREVVREYREFFDRAYDLFVNDMSVIARLENVGILTPKEAKELCAVGPTARASGVKKDVRCDYPINAYADMDWLKPVTPWDVGKEPVGDVMDRTIVRILELAQSCDIIEYCLDNMPDGEIAVEPNANKMINRLKKVTGHGIGRYEGPRGECSHYNILDKKDGPVLCKVKASTYSNIATWPAMLKGADIADIPIIIASIDPCISCSDRMSFTKKQDGSNFIMTASNLHKLSIEKQKEVQKRCC
jgi:membrane-bound hydrogenase subunit alpha